ncbi:sucrose phosphorylase [Sphingomonas sp. NCPPB 2930]
MKNQVQLITYVDRLGGGGLETLHQLLCGRLQGLFAGVHLLPFFHPIDGADAGFDPIDHARIDTRLGGWQEFRAIAQTVEVMADVIVNHVSSASHQFLHFSRHGDASLYAGLFLTLGTVFPHGATEQDLLALYRPRPGLPFTPVTLANGERRLMWTTFTPSQIDINVGHPQGETYLDSVLHALAENGTKCIRLDAVGYAVKRAGTSGFMTPETFDFIDTLSSKAHARGMEVLVEIHAPYRMQIEIARRVDWVYDFALPPLLLHALHFRTARHLKHWIGVRPTNALTVLDTHDGIGIIDIGADPADRSGRPGLVPPAELDRLVEAIHANCGGESRQATGAAASNLDLYQVNCTFFDAVGADEERYLAARAVQFFLPGIPQVYYVGLLAGRNDMDLMRQTGVGRDINRHRFTDDEIDAALARPVVGRLLDLIRQRNTHPAFGGTFTLHPSAESVLEVSWHADGVRAGLRVDFATGALSLAFGDEPPA